MVENIKSYLKEKNFKKYLKENFSNGPKAKIILGVALLAVCALMTISAMRKTVILSIDGKEKTVVTYKGTVEELLNAEGVALTSKDKVQPALQTEIEEEQKIIVKKAIPVKVKFKNKTLTLTSAEETVGSMLVAEDSYLKKNGINFNIKEDEVIPNKDSKIAKDAKIELIDVAVKTITENQVIKFDTEYVKDSSYHYTFEETQSSGQNGEKKVTYKVIMKNGKEFSKEKIKEKVVKAPKNRVVVKGTGQNFSRGGLSSPYKKMLICESTAYYGHGTTASGRKPVYNPGGISTIAVDPSVIPLGSKVYVEGYGYAIAADTGGAIKGNIVDVFLNSRSAAYTWGRKYGVRVYIIAYPGEW